MSCPNCFYEHKDFSVDPCLLHALLAAAVAGRGEITNEQAAEIMRGTNVDALWDDLGPLVDRLVAGFYAEGAETLDPLAHELLEANFTPDWSHRQIDFPIRPEVA